MPAPKKTALIISPIGGAKSEIRERANTVKDLLIKPIIEDEYDFECKRADEIYDTPKIDEDIINHLIEDDLVIADLTDHNANVFYELAVRHCFSKPVILLISSGQRLPFDISTYRAIYYDLKDVKTFEEAKQELRRQAKAVVNGEFIPDSPIKAGLTVKKSVGSIEKIDEVVAILRNHSELLNEIVYENREGIQKRNKELDHVMRITRDIAESNIKKDKNPNFIESAIANLIEEGFTLLERNMVTNWDTPNFEGYKLFELSEFSQFKNCAEENKSKGYPYVNYDRKESKLWLWNSDKKAIYTWHKISFTFVLSKSD